MIDRIIQMKVSEYDALVEKANLNEVVINELAEKYYQERGVFRIDARMGFQEKYNGDTIYYTTSFSTENGLYKNDGFKPIITEKGRRKIERIVENLCNNTFNAKFGDAIKFKNAYADALDRLNGLKWVCYAIAFSGWGVATALLLFK